MDKKNLQISNYQLSVKKQITKRNMETNNHEPRTSDNIPFVREEVRHDVKCLLKVIRYLPFDMGYARLDIGRDIDNLVCYCEAIIEKGAFRAFIEVLYESIKDCYIEIGVVNPDSRTFCFSWHNPTRDAMFEVLKNSELLGVVGLYMKDKEILDCRESMIEKLGVLAYYNRGIGQFVDFYDSHIAMLADCAASDLEQIAEQLRG